MSRFPRYLRRQLEHLDKANVDRAVGASSAYDEAHGPDSPRPVLFPGTAPGDARKLRGIPAIGRSVRGAIPGTIPGDNLLR